MSFPRQKPPKKREKHKISVYTADMTMVYLDLYMYDREISRHCDLFRGGGAHEQRETKQTPFCGFGRYYEHFPFVGLYRRENGRREYGPDSGVFVDHEPL